MKTIAKSHIGKIQRDFRRFVSDLSDTPISDYEYSDDKVSVFVDFDYCLREIVIKNIEILDNDYEEIYSENALAIRHFIEQEIADRNYAKTQFDECPNRHIENMGCLTLLNPY